MAIRINFSIWRIIANYNASRSVGFFPESSKSGNSKSVLWGTVAKMACERHFVVLPPQKKAFVKLLVVQKGALLQNSILPKVILFFQVWTTKDNAIHTRHELFFSSHLISDTMPTLKCIIYQTCWIPEKNYTFLTLQVHTTNKEDI